MKKTLTVHVDTVQFKNKPKQKDFKDLNKRLLQNKKTMTPIELSEYLSNGYTVIPSLFDTFRRKSNFIESAVIMLDFDNTDDSNYISFEDIQENDFVKQNASFMYHTFSSSFVKHKFRVVFILDKKISNIHYYNALMSKVYEMFPQIDKKCLDCSHLFYGGVNLKEINYNNYLNWENLIDISNIKIDSTLNRKSKNVELSNKITFNSDFNKTKVTGLIKNFNKQEYIDYLKNETNILQLANNYKIKEKKDVVYLFNSLNTFDLFGIDKELKTFNCILTEDSNPSATISFNEKLNMFFYSRFYSEGTLNYTNTEILMNLMDKEKDYVIHFIMEVLNLEVYLPDNLKEMKSKVHEIKTIISNKEMFKSEFPYAYKILYKHEYFISSYLDILTEFPLEVDGELKFISAKSTSTISKIIYATDKKSKTNYVYKALNLLTYLEFFHKLDVEEFPVIFKNYLMKFKIANKFKSINNIFELNKLEDVANFMISLNNNCKYLLECGYTFNGFNQDFIHRLEGNEKANEIFVQTKDKPLNTLRIEFEEDIRKILYEEFEVNKKNHILDKDVKINLKSKYSNTLIQKEYVSAMSQIILTNNFMNLERKKASKTIKQKIDLNADISYQTIIIFKSL